MAGPVLVQVTADDITVCTVDGELLVSWPTSHVKRCNFLVQSDANVITGMERTTEWFALRSAAQMNGNTMLSTSSHAISRPGLFYIATAAINELFHSIDRYGFQ